MIEPMSADPASPIVRELSMVVVGLAYPNADRSNRKFEALLCVPGEPVELIREPKNKVDPHAVAVRSARGIQIGYLSGDRCQWIGGLIERGETVRAIFQSLASVTAVIRVAIGGQEPTLPAVVSSATPSPPPAPPEEGEEPDWYPDFIPPDDAYF
jgi:Fe2+ transport system protein FeoA